MTNTLFIEFFYYFGDTMANNNGGGYGPGRGHGGGGQGRHRRGRPNISYPVDLSRSIDIHQGVLELTTFEIKLLELSDIEQNKTQEDIAKELNISQTSVWRYLKELRKKIALAIKNHNEIHIEIVDNR
ncbi:MAG: DUF134 domain-containing protein [Promethearchaeota archaeon]|nr:MAG: DUF134 domain-containing protein [Candidatus Lokiarchaeota archaeon]